MKKVQMNLQVPIDVKEFIYAQAEADDRHPAYMLEKIIRPMMTMKRYAGQSLGMVEIKGDSHTQQSLIPKLGKDHGFAGFWNAYPKKKAKAEALKAWIKNDCFKIAVNIITDVNDRVSHDPSWSDKQFIPNGATYLNGKRWEDEIITDKNAPADLAIQEYKGGSI